MSKKLQNGSIVMFRQDCCYKMILLVISLLLSLKYFCVCLAEHFDVENEKTNVGLQLACSSKFHSFM